MSSLPWELVFNGFMYFLEGLPVLNLVTLFGFIVALNIFFSVLFYNSIEPWYVMTAGSALMGYICAFPEGLTIGFHLKSCDYPSDDAL